MPYCYILFVFGSDNDLRFVFFTSSLVTFQCKSHSLYNYSVGAAVCLPNTLMIVCQACGSVVQDGDFGLTPTLGTVWITFDVAFNYD